MDDTVSSEGAESARKDKAPFKGPSRSKLDRNRTRRHPDVSKVAGKARHSQVPSEPWKAPKVEVPDFTSLFQIDRIGDPHILTYGSLNPRTIPSYFRAGAGGVVGLPRQNKIDGLARNEKFVVLSNFHHNLSQKSRRCAFGKISRSGERKLRIKTLENREEPIDPSANFIPINSTQNRSHGHRDDDDFLGLSSSSAHIGTRPYISVEEIDGVDRTFDTDLDFTTDSSVNDDEGGRSSTLAEKSQQKRIKLSQNVDADPTNCEAWLELIDYQENLIGLDHTSRKSKSTNAERQSIAGVKISLYEKAIDSVHNSNDKERLSLYMMDEGHKIWESKKLSSKWRGLLRKYPTSTALWVKYTDFMQSEFSSFRYEEVRAAYLDCLGVLREARRLAERDADIDAIYANQVYVLLRMTIFMRESGFSEHAVASWEAVLEYVFFKPEEFQSQKYKSGGPLESESVSAFQEFWESEVPRIGEDCAEGWAVYMTRKGRSSEPREDVQDNLGKRGELFESWAQSERQQSLQSRAPARTIDEVGEIDPYRIILFSDIQESLFDPPHLSNGPLLVTALLTFCHLPPYSTEHTDGYSRKWWRDSFCRNETLYQSHNLLTKWESGSHTAKTEMNTLDRVVQDPVKKDPFRFCIPDYRLSSSSLFAASGSWFSAFDHWEDECCEDQGPVEVAWVRRIIESLASHGIGGEHLAEYSLALELRFSPATVRKTAKTLIKIQSSSIRLYNSFALIEYHLGNTTSAEKVIVMTINMSKTLGDQAQRDSMLLWTSWIWAMLDAGQASLALERILKFPDQNIDVNAVKLENSSSREVFAPEPTLLLRTQKV